MKPRPLDPQGHCRISYGGGLGTSPRIMGLTTQDPYIPKEHTELYKILKLRVNWANIEQDIHILKDFTSTDQRLLFNKVKRLQLKLTRYEQHKNNYTYYYKHKIIPKGLVIKCRPNIDATFNKRFYQQWKGLLTATS